MTKPVQILVAGNRGFIGSHLQRGLSNAGHEVQGADRGEVEAALAAQPPQALIWAAGSRSADAAMMQAQHVDAPLAALTAGPLERFIYLSTGEVYGPQTAPFSEELAPAPQSPYACAKVEGENRLAEAAARQGTKLTVFRISLAYGPGQQGPMFIPTLIEHLRRGAVLPMTAGEQTRDFIFIDDIVRVVQQVVASDLGSRLYNLGSGEETRLIDLAKLVARAIGGNAEQLLDAGALPYRPAEQMRYLLDTARARDELHFEPSISLQEGIRRTVAR